MEIILEKLNEIMRSELFKPWARQGVCGSENRFRNGILLNEDLFFDLSIQSSTSL